MNAMSRMGAATPLDVKLMNFTSSMLIALCIAACLGTLAWWAMRQPVFALRAIRVQGEVTHNSAATLRANVAPRLAGNFFTIDLAAARSVFETVPWVRKAAVRREFPDRLQVLLEEHRAVAYWGSESEPRLLNSFGEVFEANAGEIDAENLPRLGGPDAQSAEALAMFRSLQPMFANLDLGLEELYLSGRGSWRAELDTSATVELGAGSVDEVSSRARRFLQTLNQVASRYGRRADALESADLRHSDGYALRLRGVSTTTAADAAKKQ
jgi:cell division protein FtsQ